MLLRGNYLSGGGAYSQGEVEGEAAVPSQHAPLEHVCRQPGGSADVCL